VSRITSVLSFGFLLSAAYLQAQVNVTANRYDVNRTAANIKETALNTTNVDPVTFGKLWSYPVTGVIFAQPLYVQGLSIGSKGNVLFVATMQNNLYAFDADKSGPALWTRNLGTPVSSTTWSSEIGTHIGVMSTPVIDTPSNSGSMYVVAQTLENNNWVYRLHKISLLTGQDVVSSSVISASQGTTTFDPKQQNQRPGLVLVNGQVVIMFSGRPHDDRPYHGWVMTYDASSLAQKGAFLTTTSDDGAGVWGSGGAPPVDAAGNFYVLTGNAFNSSTGYNGGNGNYSETLLKMSNAGGTLQLSDWFTAYNWSSLDSLDEDLSCNSPMLMPGSTASSDLLTFGSKTADIYVADLTKPLGHLQNNNSQLAGFFHVGANNPAKFSDGDRILGLAYWQGPMGKTVFAWPAFDSLHSYVYTFNGTSWTFALNKSNPIKGFGEPGVPISVSANGTQSGTGVVWATMYSSSGRAVGQAGELHAFDAETLDEIWNSSMSFSRDDIGSPAKFVIPVVANGRVYAAAATVATPSNTTGVVQVYGLLPPPTGGGSITATASNSSAAVNLTAEGGADWIHWGDSTLNRKAGVTAALTTYTVVGGGPVLTGNGDQRAISWSDGTPTASATANINGAFTYGAVGDGFSFTAPAGTSVQTLTVHVGGFGSSGILTAHLSDGSAPDYTNTTAFVSGQYDQNYTLSYKAGSAGQKLAITWVIASGTGNVSVQGAALAGASQPVVTAPPTFSPGGGTYTSAQSVSLSDSTSGAVIYYTTDGSTPTTSSTKYTSPILVSSSKTIKAFAVASGATPSAVVSASYTVQTSQPPPTIDYDSGFTTVGLALNGTASVTGTRLQLTDGGSNEAASAFYTTPVNIQSFTTQFKFQVTKANADGFTFIVQNSGLNALGSSGGGLGSQNIGKSVALKFDLYNSAGEGTSSTGIYLNGAVPTVPATDLLSHGINLHSGDTFQTQLSYDGTNLTLTITDTVTAATFTTVFPVNIPGTVGAATAYMGFTGGTGGATAIQQIVEWTYTAGAGTTPPPSATATPAFNPPSGTTFTSPQSVTLSDATSAATIYYTTNGTTPTRSSTVYSSSILVSNSETIKAFATSPGNTDSAVASASYTVQTSQPPAIDFSSGFTTTGLTLNGKATVTGTRLQLTDGGTNEASSAYYSTPVNIQSFTTQFLFQLTNANADGFTFIIQNSGLNALGSSGGGLGSQNIAKSVAVKFDLYNSAGEGTSSTGVYLNGAVPTVPSTDLLSHGIKLHSGDTFKVQLSYNGTNLSLTITDTVTAATFTTAFPVNISGTVGGTTAYVGFTGGTGGATAIQQIVQWTYNTP
jgi:hypothetical protein